MDFMAIMIILAVRPCEGGLDGGSSHPRRGRVRERGNKEVLKQRGMWRWTQQWQWLAVSVTD